MDGAPGVGKLFLLRTIFEKNHPIQRIESNVLIYFVERWPRPRGAALNNHRSSSFQPGLRQATRDEAMASSEAGAKGSEIAASGLTTGR